MRNVAKKRIGDFDYRVRQLADPEGSRLFTRLTKIVAPTVAAGLGGLPENGAGVDLSDMSTKAIADALITLSDRVSEEDVMYLSDTLAAETQFSPTGQGQWVPLSSDASHWSGRYLQKIQWIAFALEVNYADFLSAPGPQAFGAMFRAARGSQSPDISTGESSESSPPIATA